jgi:hypothetical protein
MMKKTALAIATFAWLGAAQAQEVPKLNCDPKPEYPGRLGMSVDSKRKLFERDMKKYQECVKVYLDERNTAIKANDVAGKAAYEDYQTFMKQIQEAQKE